MVQPCWIRGIGESLTLKCPRSSVVEHFLGKEEVIGSIPIVGSISVNWLRAAGSAFRWFNGSISRSVWSGPGTDLGRWGTLFIWHAASVSVGIIPQQRIRRKLRIDWSLRSIAVSVESTLLTKKRSNDRWLSVWSDVRRSGKPFFGRVFPNLSWPCYTQFNRPVALIG